MLHFDTNALIALPLWAREGHPAIARVLAGEAVAVSALVWHEVLASPLAETEAGLARAFLEGRILSVGETPPSRRRSSSMPPAANAR